MKTLLGTVVSTKMDKTVVVEVSRIYTHRLYGKQIRRAKRYKVHNEGIKLHSGDKVRIVETTPISKEKHFKVVEIVK